MENKIHSEKGEKLMGEHGKPMESKEKKHEGKPMENER